MPSNHSNQKLNNLPNTLSSQSPLVSIGIPVYNSDSTLAAAIESALAQDYENLEIIISNNASTDNSAKICKSYQNQDSRIVFYEQSENIGALRNFTFLLGEARGDYFKWLAADDVISKNSVSSCMTVLQENPQSVACASPHLFDHEYSANKTPISFQLSGSEYSRINGFFKSPGRSHGLFYALIKRDELLSYPLLSVDFFAADWCLILYLLSKGPIESAQNTYLQSGSSGLSSSDAIYVHYGLTGWRRVLPLREFTFAAVETSMNWTKLARILLYLFLLRLNLKTLLLEYRILRYRFSGLRKRAILLFKKFC